MARGEKSLRRSIIIAVAARFEHPVHLIERHQRPREILESRPTDDEVELIVGKRQVGRVAVLEVDADARVARVLAGDPHERAADIDPAHPAAGQPCQSDGEITRSRRDFEHARPGVQMRGDPARRALEFFAVMRRLPRIPGRDETFHVTAQIGGRD